MPDKHITTVPIAVRHATITLTIDNHDHIFSGQAEEAPIELAAILRQPILWANALLA